MQAAFAALARHADAIGGKVKVTAFEELEELPLPLPLPSAAAGSSKGGGGGDKDAADVVGGDCGSSAGSLGGPAPGTVNLLAFPAGVLFEGVAVERVGQAVALAAADDPEALPLRDSEIRALEGRMVSLLRLVCGGGWGGREASPRAPAPSG